MELWLTFPPPFSDKLFSLLLLNLLKLENFLHKFGSISLIQQLWAGKLIIINIFISSFFLNSNNRLFKIVWNNQYAHSITH